MKPIHIFLLAIFNIGIGCSVNPKPIDYGHIACHYCSMTIVDQQHAAQLVTTKGKVFNFDAVECMMNQLKDEDKSTIALFLVNDFDQPGALVDAKKATYLICENIPSPMGAYLTSFADEKAALYTRNKQGGELYSWEEIKKRFKL